MFYNSTEVEEATEVQKNGDPALELRLVMGSFWRTRHIELYSPLHDAKAVLGKFDGKMDRVERFNGTGDPISIYYELNSADRQRATAEYERLSELLRRGDYSVSVDGKELRVEF